MSELTTQNVELLVMFLFEVTDIEYDFSDNKKSDIKKLEQYFEQKKNFVLQSILKHKILIGSSLIFQSLGVWDIGIEGVTYFLDYEEVVKDKRILNISVKYSSNF